MAQVGGGGFPGPVPPQFGTIGKRYSQPDNLGPLARLFGAVLTAFQDYTSPFAEQTFIRVVIL